MARGAQSGEPHDWVTRAADDAVRHAHDRFRKEPAGVVPAWSEHIGRPLSAVPDPWSCHDSWAEHFKAPLRAEES